MVGEEQRNKVGDDDRQSRAFILVKSGCMMDMIAGREGVEMKGKRGRNGVRLTERNV